MDKAGKQSPAVGRNWPAAADRFIVVDDKWGYKGDARLSLPDAPSRLGTVIRSAKASVGGRRNRPFDPCRGV
jgi:hypothetical protein